MKSDPTPMGHCDDVERVLSGHVAYDDVAEHAQEAIRAVWRGLFDADRAALDLRARFAGEGRTRWSEADHHGYPTVHRAAHD